MAFGSSESHWIFASHLFSPTISEEVAHISEPQSGYARFVAHGRRVLRNIPLTEALASMADHNSTRILCFCALRVSRCGAIATVTEGRFVVLDADPEHPTGQALCLKGKVAPEIVYHSQRLLRPLKRTRPKGVLIPVG